MRIEITVEGNEPIIHRLTKEKTLVGSGADCDIQVNAEGVSRKHLLIIGKDDQFFVVDQGSTNGSYVDESRLVPGQRSEFNSFFPIRLGHAVTVALLADEEGAPKFELSKSLTEAPAPVAKKTEPKVAAVQKKSAGTGSIKHIPPARATKSGATVPRGKKGPPVLESNSKEDQQRMRNTKVIAFIVLIGGLAYYYFQREAPPETVAQAPVEQPSAAPKMKVSELKLVDTVPSNVMGIQNYIGMPKCNTTETEKSLCNALALPLEKIPASGIRRENDVIQFFLPALKGENVFDHIAKKLDINESFKTNFAKVTSQNDLIDFFLGRIDPTLWKTYSEGARWVVVVFIDSMNVPEENVWFAPLATLATAYETPEYGARKESYNTGMVSLNIIGGLFRVGSP